MFSLISPYSPPIFLVDMDAAESGYTVAVYHYLTGFKVPRDIYYHYFKY